MYSLSAAVTASFLVLCFPARRASSINESSKAKLVAMCRVLHIVLCSSRRHGTIEFPDFRETVLNPSVERHGDITHRRKSKSRLGCGANLQAMRASDDEGGSEVDTLRCRVVAGYEVRSNWTIEVPLESSRSRRLCAKAGALSGCATPDDVKIYDSAESTTAEIINDGTRYNFSLSMASLRYALVAYVRGPVGEFVENLRRSEERRVG